MADRRRKATTTSSTFLHNLKTHMPSPTQLLSLVTFITTSSVLIIFTGSTLIGILIFAPLMIVSIPIWFPVGAFLFTAVSGFLLFCGFSVTVIVGLLWTYRYFRGMHPPGADRVDYARSRIYDTASHVKDYAREYGGYLHIKVKDAAPGA